MTHIDVQCPQCQASLRVKAQWAGRRGACPRCRQTIDLQPIPPDHQPAASTQGPIRQPPLVPLPAKTGGPTPVAAHPAVPAAGAPPRPLAEEILSGFAGPIEQPPRDRAFNVALAAVAAAMLLFPLLYAGMIVLFAGLLFSSFPGMPRDSYGRSAETGFAVFLLCKFILTVMVVFLLKPLFAPRIYAEKPRSLTPQGEPLLFAFVDRLCQALGAPKPARIDVDCQINASASLRRGMRSLANDDLVLTIGLPVVAGLSLQEFAGVLAHEFGHFSQRAGMRMSYVVRVISMWLTRIVYERDVWDVRLRGFTEVRGAGAFAYGAMAGIWLTRKLLWVLMMGGHLVSALLLRQMEFDADRYEARLAGSNHFAPTSRRLFLLNLASQGAYSDFELFLDEGRLADNLPRLIEANVPQLPKEAIAAADEALTIEKTGLLDTHPCHAERTASALAEQASGVFQSARPAAALFADFPALCKTVTVDVYRNLFGSRFRITQMHSVEKLLQKQEGQLEALKLLRRYTQSAFHPTRPLRWPGTWLSEPADPRPVVARLREARSDFERRAPQYSAWLKEWQETEGAGSEILQARALADADLKIKPDMFRLKCTKVDELRGHATRVTAQREAIAAPMAAFELLTGARLFAALELLHHYKVAAKFPDAQRQQARASQMLDAAYYLGNRADELLKLRRDSDVLAILIGQISGNEKNRGLLQQIAKQMNKYWHNLLAIRTGLNEMQYPFDHATGAVTIAQFVLPELPSPDDPAAMLAAASMIDRAFLLYARVLSELATLAERVEQLIGLPPLPEPAEEKTEEAAVGSVPPRPVKAGGPSLR